MKQMKLIGYEELILFNRDEKLLPPPSLSMAKCSIKPRILSQYVKQQHQKQQEEEEEEDQTQTQASQYKWNSALQQTLFPLINNYIDVFYPFESYKNAHELREMFALHALNHVLKTRDRIIANNL